MDSRIKNSDSFNQHESQKWRPRTSFSMSNFVLAAAKPLRRQYKLASSQGLTRLCTKTKKIWSPLPLQKTWGSTNYTASKYISNEKGPPKKMCRMWRPVRLFAFMHLKRQWISSFLHIFIRVFHHNKRTNDEWVHLKKNSVIKSKMQEKYLAITHHINFVTERITLNMLSPGKILPPDGTILMAKGSRYNSVISGKVSLWLCCVTW